MPIMKRNTLFSAFVFVGILLFGCGTLAAQNRTFKGKVVDDKGQPVEGARVTIDGQDIVMHFETKTNKSGEYVYLIGMQSGTFRMVVRKEGFQPAFKENLRPPLGEPLVTDLTLQSGADYPLPWELSDEEKEAYLKQAEQARKRKEMEGEIKAAFDEGKAMAEAGNHAGAIESFRKVLEKAPDEPVIYAAIAKSQTDLGQNEEALASYNKAIELDEYNPSYFMNRGVVLNALGKVEEAREAFKKSAELDPGNAGQTYYNLGATLVNSGDMTGAVEAFKQSIASDPNYAEAYYQLGICLSGGDQESVAAAIEALKKYIELGGKDDQVEVAKQIIDVLGGQ
ncbi:MAG: tetratricopeptide repeat protein [Acidobacteria bacterium]|nr:tetratricopeptide repeat protein [Acidobacteriota bacterium]